MEETKTRGAGGSLQSEWTGSGSLPVSEWSSEIIGESLLESPILETAIMKRGNKKTYYLLSSVTTQTNLWATGVTSVESASYETLLDYDAAYIDPVEYRTYTPVAWETFDEIDANIEGDLRNMLAHQARRKFQLIAWTALDDGAIDSAYDWATGGNALAYCDTNTAIDWGDSFTTDNVIAGYESLIGAGYNATDCFVPPAMYADLFAESQFTNAAQYGSQNTAIIDGIIPKFMGCNIHLDQHMPDDSSDKDVGIMCDRKFFLGMLVAKDAQLDYKNNFETGEHRFFMTVKAGSKVFREAAGVAFYS